MSALVQWLGAALVVAGTVTISLGTVGLIRLPDALTRLHALTKADNAGLGLCVLGLALIGQDPVTAVTMLLIWVRVMLPGATAATLIARRHVEREEHS